MDELRSKLFYEQKNGYDLIDTDESIAVEDYCGQYMSYLNDSRTERERSRTQLRWPRSRALSSMSSAWS